MLLLRTTYFLSCKLCFSHMLLSMKMTQECIRSRPFVPNRTSTQPHATENSVLLPSSYFKISSTRTTLKQHAHTHTRARTHTHTQYNISMTYICMMQQRTTTCGHSATFLRVPAMLSSSSLSFHKETPEEIQWTGISFVISINHSLSSLPSSLSCPDLFPTSLR
jgi:hypothetical protein